MLRYANGPLVYLFDQETHTKKKKQLLWGDWLRVDKEHNDGWADVKWGKDTFSIKQSDYQEESILEVIFLDVGQGDSCLVVTPGKENEQKALIIDAGIGGNTNGYLKYRFRDFGSPFNLHSAIITHPDQDHYKGFQKIFENKKFTFDNVFHNGLTERVGDDLLGPSDATERYLTDLRSTDQSIRNLYKNKNVRGGKRYPKLIWAALTSGRVKNISMLSTKHGENHNGRMWIPEISPKQSDEFAIEVLGPVVEETPNGDLGLRWFGSKPDSKAHDTGKTKNGHSVLLRLAYRDFRLLFGGDLNLASETFLLRHYGNGGKKPTTEAEVNAMVKSASEQFGSDMMKSCHHGSADVTDEFLQAVHPIGFIVSSGDQEGHVHPRPELLGRLGKQGRGRQPLILCTELLRSTREFEDPKLRKKQRKINTAIEKINRVLNSLNGLEKEQKEEELKKLKKERNELNDELFKRNVGVYGAINIRTNGEKVVIAFRKENAPSVNKWFIYELEKNNDGEFELVS